MQQNHSFRKRAALLINTLVVVLSLVVLVSAGSVNAAPPQQSPTIPQSPLRVMVPTDQAWASLEAQGYNSMYDVFPNLTPASYQPGPRMPILDQLDAARLSSGPNGVMPPTTFRTLAILVDFSDNTATAPAAYFDTLMFGPGAGTMWGVYDQASYGLLDIVTLNLPSTMGWERMPQTYSYYVGSNNCTGSYPNNCQKLTEDAVAAVDSVVNFSNYDNDGDGYVDTVFIIHAGGGAEAGAPNAIWSHSWWVWNEPVHDGVKIGSYTTEPEFWFNVSAATSDMTHGVYAHELGHALGLPDLYDIDYSSSGIGDWSMMAGGSWNGNLGNSPAQFDAWSRVFLGFNDVVNVTGTNQTINIPNVLNNQSNSIFRLNGGNANEYWLLENRQLLGSDAALPAAGLLIWHVDNNVPGSNDSECKQQNNFLCNGTGNHFRVALEQANGLYQLENGTSQGNGGHPFPGTTVNRTFNYTSNPNTSSYYTNSDLGVSVTEISNSMSTMTAKIGLDPSITDPVILSSPADNALLTDTTPTFVWNSLSGATKYNLQVDDDAGFGSPAIDRQQAGTSYTPLGSLGNDTFYWRVRAAGSDNLWGPWSDVWDFEIDTIPPAAPTLLSPTNEFNTSDNTPTFMWNAVGDANNYEIQIDTNQNFNTGNLVYGAPNVAQFTPGAPLTDQPWYWRVRAMDLAGNTGPWSSVWTLYIDAVPTPIPTLLDPPDGDLTNDRTPTFNWTDEAAVVRYNILVDDDPGFGSPRVNVNPILSTYTPNFTPLTDGMWYWKVRALGADGNWGNWSDMWDFTIDTVRPVRPILTDPASGSTVQSSAFNLYWNAVLDSFGYDVQADTNPFFGTGNRIDDQVFTEMATVNFPFDGRWYWRVRAFDEAGNVGPWSATWNVFVDGVVTPVPTLLAPDDNLLTRDRVFDFDWTDETGVNRYNIQVNSQDDFMGIMRVNANPVASQFRNAVQPLGNGMWYWRVRARGTDNIWGDWSSVRMINVDLQRPDRPVLISPAFDEVVNDSTPTFEWGAIGDAVEYILQIDRNAFFRTADLHTYTGIGTNMHTIPDDLYDGQWFWRVLAVDLAGNQSFWSANSRFFVDAVVTPVPTLVSPADLDLTNQAVQTFDWTDEAGVNRYNIQVNSQDDFMGMMRVNASPVASQFTNNVLPLGNGVWYWRVRARGTDNIWGNWSDVRSLEVDRVRPARPTLADPLNNTTTADNTPTFMWNAVADADVVGYIIQIDKNYFFASPDRIMEQVAGTQYTPAAPLSDRRWFWRVAAVDAAGNQGPWSQFWTVIVDTGALTSEAGTGKWSNLTQEQLIELWKQRNGR